jgi:hypothetical protein
MSTNDILPYEKTVIFVSRKTYEFTDHLGNVSATISDRKITIAVAAGDAVASYTPEVLSEQDYFPGGMGMMGRSLTAEGYRYGFNGQEKETEITGSPSHTSAEFWMYDSRLGRRWNVDPKPNESISQYSCFGNNPIFYFDLHGDTIVPPAGGFIGTPADQNASIALESETLMGLMQKFQTAGDLDLVKDKKTGKYYSGELSDATLRIVYNEGLQPGLTTFSLRNGATTGDFNMSDVIITINLSQNGNIPQFVRLIAWSHEFGVHLNDLVDILTMYQRDGDDVEAWRALNFLNGIGHATVWDNNNQQTGNDTFNKISLDFGETIDQRFTSRNGFSVPSGVIFNPANIAGSMANWAMFQSITNVPTTSRRFLPIDLSNDLHVRDQFRNINIYSSKGTRGFNINFSYATAYRMALNAHKSAYDPRAVPSIIGALPPGPILRIRR